MKFMKRSNDESGIRTVWSDDKKVCFGVMGTVGDLLNEGIFEYTDYFPKTWAFVPAPGVRKKPWFGATREAVVKYLGQIPLMGKPEQMR